MFGWNLKPLHVQLVGLPLDLAHRGPTHVRVDRAERDQHVGVGRRALGDLVDRHRRHTHRRARVDGEDDGSHVPLAVVLRHLADRRPVPIDDAEVLVGGLLELRRQRAAPVDARHLDVGVHVDGDERVDIDRAHPPDRSNP